MEVCEYGRGLAIFGETKPVKDHIKLKYNGKYNKFLTHPLKNVKEPGWIVSKDHLNSLVKDSGMRVKLINTKGGNFEEKAKDSASSSSAAAAELIAKQGIAIEPVAKSKPKALLSRLSSDNEKVAAAPLIGKRKSSEEEDDDEPLVKTQKLLG